MSAPFSPEDFEELVARPGQNICLRIVNRFRFRIMVWKFMRWILTETGELSAAFKEMLCAIECGDFTTTTTTDVTTTTTTAALTCEDIQGLPGYTDNYLLMTLLETKESSDPEIGATWEGLDPECYYWTRGEGSDIAEPVAFGSTEVTHLGTTGEVYLYSCGIECAPPTTTTTTTTAP